MQGKKIVLTFRVSEQERDEIRRQAKANQMTESAYMRFMLSQKPKDYPEVRTLLRSLINEVNHIGVNINQIVKSHNSGFYHPQDKELLTAYLKKLNTAVAEVVRQLGNQ